jgi:S1-C subfamily serine protease
MLRSANSPAGLLTIFLGLLLRLLAAAAPQNASDDSTLSSAVCPLVYQLDDSPGSRGYHYSFLGNAFFVNEQGYLLTVAHVLDTFRDGGQPYIFVSRPNSPPRLLHANIIAVDHQHDVAILRASPNPFDAKYKVAFLSLTSDPASRGRSVIALSLHPPKLQNAHTFEIPIEDRSNGEILSFESTQLEKASPAAEVFLLSHSVTLGQSGSPVLALDSNAVVGLVEGRWLRFSAASALKSASTPGAAIPVQYAIDLLQRHSIPWRPVPLSSQAPSSPQSNDNRH